MPARKMWLGPLLALAVLAAFRPQQVRADDPSLSVTVNRDKLYLGESLLIEVKVGGSLTPPPPDLRTIRNGTPELLGSQPQSFHSIININGHVRSEGFTGRIFTYKLTPQREGCFTIGPITATVGGQSLSAMGPSVTVTGVTRQEIVAIQVTASRETVLVDEPFEILVAVRLRRLPGRFAEVDPLFPGDPPHLEGAFLDGNPIEGLKCPDLHAALNNLMVARNQPGFTINNFSVQPDLFESMMNPQGVAARFKFPRRLVTEGDKEYWEYAFSLAYSPLAEGSYTFGPLLFKGTVPATVDAGGNASGMPVFAVGPAALVRVIPPPETNRPDCYVGAIGSNLVIEAALDAQSCHVGDPLTLTLTLSGPVQMRNLTAPRLSLQPAIREAFEVYDDTVQTTRQEGQCRYTYTLRPLKKGSFELPPVEVAFYDVTTRAYRLVRTPPIPLKVRQATEITAEQVIGGSTNQALQLHHEEASRSQPAGMRYTPEGTTTVPLLGDPMRLAGVALAGPLLFLGASLARLVARRLPQWRRNRRQRQATPRARRRLKSCQPAEVCSILRSYLADRFLVQTASLTPAEAQDLLMAKGIPEPLAREFAIRMQPFFDAAFGTGIHPQASPAEELVTLLSRIEDGAAPRQERSRTLLTLLLLAGLSMRLDASPTSEHSFIWDEAVSEMSTAQSAGDYLAAAATLQKLVDLGIRNPTLFYNQGTALLLADKPAEALTLLRRAERYGGSGADVRRNLSLAEARQAGLKTPVESWRRIVFFWHYRLDCATRSLWAAAGFSLAWIAGLLALAGWRRFARLLALASLVLMISFGSSVLTSLQQENQVQSPPSLQASR